MTAAASALAYPAGMELRPGAVGQQKVVDVDIVWTSSISNGTADKTVNAADVGMQHIRGAHFLGDVGALHSGTDVAPVCVVTFVDNDTITVQALTAAGAALDLDSTDVAAVRLRISGD